MSKNTAHNQKKQNTLLILTLTLAALTLLRLSAHAQEPIEIKTKLESPQPPPAGWTVGDQIPLRLTVTYSDNLRVILPQLPKTWGAFEIVKQTPPSTNQDPSSSSQQIIVTAWQPGEQQTPSFNVYYRDESDQLYEAIVSPISIHIASVLTEEDAELRALKPQVSLPHPPVWPWLLGAALSLVAFGAAACWLWRRLRRRPAPALAPSPPPDPRPPDVIAYAELERIAQLKLPVQGEFKRHYTLVSDCLRDYVERLYHIPALDRTTNELWRALRQIRINRELVSHLRHVLDASDLVKFARHHPDVGQAESALEQARDFVQSTSIEVSD